MLAVLCLGTRWLAAEPTHDLVVIVNPHNHAPVSSAVLENLFLRKTRHWEDGAAVVPLNLAHDTVARQVFDRDVLRMAPDEAARYWLDQRIRDGTSAPREIGDPTVVVKLVAHFEGAIGYVPASTPIDGVTVVALIRQGKVVAP